MKEERENVPPPRKKVIKKKVERSNLTKAPLLWRLKNPQKQYVLFILGSGVSEASLNHSVCNETRFEFMHFNFTIHSFGREETNHLDFHKC